MDNPFFFFFSSFLSLKSCIFLFLGVSAEFCVEEEDKLKKKLLCAFPKLRNEGMLVGLCWFVVGKNRGEFEFENGNLNLT